MIDPANPVVKLCAEGIGAESRHDYAQARAFYMQAWELRTDDYEACLAARSVHIVRDGLTRGLERTQGG